jgi:hypothetical protein
MYVSKIIHCIWAALTKKQQQQQHNRLQKTTTLLDEAPIFVQKHMLLYFCLKGKYCHSFVLWYCLGEITFDGSEGSLWIL